MKFKYKSLSTLLLCLSIASTKSQNIFTSLETNKRTNFCPLHRQVERDEIPRFEALRGQTITVAIAKEIDESNPDIAVRVLDEVARRAKFNYIAYVTGFPHEEETWTDLLKRNTKNFDLAVHKWDRTLERLSLNMVYPETWYDADSILVMKQESNDDSFVFFSFLLPLSPSLWFLIIVTIVITGLLYYFLDFLHSHADKSKMFSTIEGCIFTSFDSYTSSGSAFSPRSRASRILVISMAFLYLILISAYTANLANYYIEKSKPKFTITDVNDAISNNQLFCLARGFANSESLKTLYKKAKYIEVNSERDQMLALTEARCDVALISVASFQTLKLDQNVNKNCDLSWVGRRVFSNKAGFALNDSEEYCSSLLDNIIDFQLLQMKKDGKTEEILAEYRANSTENLCRSNNEDSIKDASISIINMGGAFAFHLLIVVVSIVVAFYDYYQQPQEVKSRVNNQLRNSFTTSIVLWEPNFRHGISNISSDESINPEEALGSSATEQVTDEEDEEEEDEEEEEDDEALSEQNQLLLEKIEEILVEQNKEIILSYEKQIHELVESMNHQRILQENLQAELREIKGQVEDMDFH